MGRLARCLIYLVAVVGPGCQSFYSYRPVGVLVRDAETKQPIASADVHVSYPLMPSAQSPHESAGRTDGDGIVRLQAAPSGPAGVLVEATHVGYLFEKKTIPVETIQTVQPAGWFENVQRRPASVVIELYAEPRPVVELVLPVGFRGLIKAEVQARPEAANKSGQRQFTYSVEPGGHVDVIGPALLARAAPLDYQGRYPDGTPLSREPKGLDLGFWSLRADGSHLTFFVGTQTEFEAMRSAEFSRGSGPGQAGSGGKGGGGGGRRGGGHKGGQSSGNLPAPDPNP
jgi:hypothetical protein